jgi:hypothetical protein
MDQGRVNFSRWFTRVMDTNGWSHPTLVALCKCTTGDQALIHSSQIAGLRSARLKSPGPRCFAALEYLWRAIENYQHKGKVVVFGSLASRVQKAEIMRDPDDQPASLGYMVEVFTGLLPVPIDLNIVEFTDSQAQIVSENAGRLVRRMMAQANWDLIDDIHKITDKFSKDRHTCDVMKDIIIGQKVWTPDELYTRLSDLTRMLNRTFEYDRTIPELMEELLKK